MRTLRIVAVLLLPVGVSAAEVRSTSHGRVGMAVERSRGVVRSAVDIADMDGQHTPSDAGDPMLEAELDSTTNVYPVGVAPILTVRLRRADGAPVDAVVTVNDRPAVRKSAGTYTAALDTTPPGEHVVTVEADAVVDGNSLHRAVTVVYSTASGNLVVTAVGAPTQDDTWLFVPLLVTCTEPGTYHLQATLVSEGVTVARAETDALIGPGNDTVNLQFALTDLVEPGPYRLSDVFVNQGGPNGGTPADVQEQIGPLISVRPDKRMKPPPAPHQLDPQGQADHDLLERILRDGSDSG